MSSCRHLETYGLAERVNNTVTHFSSFFVAVVATTVLSGQTYYLKWNLRTMLFVDSELSTPPSRLTLVFFPREPFDLLFNMRPSISLSQNALERLKWLHDVHTRVRCVLQLHKD
jgi:hypothetical protein